MHVNEAVTRASAAAAALVFSSKLLLLYSGAFRLALRLDWTRLDPIQHPLLSLSRFSLSL